MRDVRDAFARFWPLTRGDRRWLALIVGCVVVAALTETASILLFARVTDHALKAGSLAAFWGPAGAWLGAAVLGAFIGCLGNSLAVWTAERFVLRLRADVFRHVQELPPDFFQRHRQGDLVERLTGDVEAIEQMVVSGVVGTVGAVFSAVFYAAAALWIRWDLALVTFVLAPLFLLAARRFSGRIRKASQEERAAGVIRLDGVPLGDLPLEFLRENVALLPQQTLIVHGTIRENIECGRPGATDEQIMQAARDAAAHEFISPLPEGYATRIAPGTAALSGGQLQRIAIARAMLRAAPVMILDEPTAGLDSVAARQVVQPLRRLMAGRTTIVITHDLSLAPDADRILVLDGGRLVEAGTHDALMALGGSYAALATPGAARSAVPAPV